MVQLSEDRPKSTLGTLSQVILQLCEDVDYIETNPAIEEAYRVLAREVGLQVIACPENRNDILSSFYDEGNHPDNLADEYQVYPEDIIKVIRKGSFNYFGEKISTGNL